MFKFTIRELLLLTLVVGLSFGWALRERQYSVDQQRVDAITGALYACGFSVEWGQKSVRLILPDGKPMLAWPYDPPRS